MRELVKFLSRHNRVAIDTMVFIYLLESNVKYVRLADAVFKWVASEGHSGVTSTITLTELLVGLYKDEGTLGEFFGGGAKDINAEGYRPSGAEKAPMVRILLETYPHLEWIAPHTGIADLAASFRARYRLKTPDALQAATAVLAGATGFVTNDGSLSQVVELDVIQFDDLT